MAGNKNSGFASHPELINRKGRPKKGQTLTDALRARVDKQELADLLVRLAMENEDLAAARYIYDRIDGKPKETVEQFIHDLPEVVEIDLQDSSDPCDAQVVDE